MIILHTKEPFYGLLQDKDSIIRGTKAKIFNALSMRVDENRSFYWDLVENQEHYNKWVSPTQYGLYVELYVGYKKGSQNDWKATTSSP